MFNADNNFHLMLQFHVVVHKLFNTFCKTKTRSRRENSNGILYVFYAETMEVEKLLCLFSNCFCWLNNRVLIMPFLSFRFLMPKTRIFPSIVRKEIERWGGGRNEFGLCWPASSDSPASLFQIMKIPRNTTMLCKHLPSAQPNWFLKLYRFWAFDGILIFLHSKYVFVGRGDLNIFEFNWIKIRENWWGFGSFLWGFERWNFNKFEFWRKVL